MLGWPETTTLTALGTNSSVLYRSFRAGGKDVPGHNKSNCAFLATPGPLYLPLPLLQKGAPAVLLLDAVEEWVAAGHPHPQKRGGAAPRHQTVEADRKGRGLAPTSPSWCCSRPAPGSCLQGLLLQGVAALLSTLQLGPLGQHLGALPQQAPLHQALQVGGRPQGAGEAVPVQEVGRGRGRSWGRGRGRSWGRSRGWGRGRSAHHPSVSVLVAGSTCATKSTMAVAALSSLSVTRLITLLSLPSTLRPYLQTPHYTCCHMSLSTSV